MYTCNTIVWLIQVQSHTIYMSTCTCVIIGANIPVLWLNVAYFKCIPIFWLFVFIFLNKFFVFLQIMKDKNKQRFWKKNLCTRMFRPMFWARLLKENDPWKYFRSQLRGGRDLEDYNSEGQLLYGLHNEYNLL